MLDYLRREEIFLPAGQPLGKKGKRRRYTYADVVLLRALHGICEGRGKIRHLKADLARFREEFGSLRPGQRVEKCLFVLGDELCVRTGVESGRQVRSGQLTLGFFVDLGAVSQDIADSVVVPGPSRLEFHLTPTAAARAEAVKMQHWEPIRLRREVQR